MKKSIQITLASVLLLSSLFFSGQFSPVTARETNIMEFDTMVGVPSGLTGAQSPIRGINGGGLPWVLPEICQQILIWSKSSRKIIDFSPVFTHVSAVGFIVFPPDFHAIFTGFRAAVSPQSVISISEFSRSICPSIYS